MGWKVSDQADQLAVEDDRLDLLEEVQAEGTIVCALTGSQYKDTAYEQTLQSLIEQLHREYDVALEDMERDFRVALEIEDPHSGMIKVQRKTASLAVFETETSHSQENIIRVAVVAKSGDEAGSEEGDTRAGGNPRESQ